MLLLGRCLLNVVPLEHGGTAGSGRAHSVAIVCRQSCRASHSALSVNRRYSCTAIITQRKEIVRLLLSFVIIANHSTSEVENVLFTFDFVNFHHLRCDSICRNVTWTIFAILHRLLFFVICNFF